MEDTPPEGGWALVLWRLNDQGRTLERLEDKVDSVMIDVAMLKVKAGIWGAVAGLIPASLALALIALN